MAKKPNNALSLDPVSLAALDALAKMQNEANQLARAAAAKAATKTAAAIPGGVTPEQLTAVVAAAQQAASRLPGGSASQQAAADRAAKQAVAEHSTQVAVKTAVDRFATGRSDVARGAIEAAVRQAVANTAGSPEVKAREANQAALRAAMMQSMTAGAAKGGPEAMRQQIATAVAAAAARTSGSSSAVAAAARTAAQQAAHDYRREEAIRGAVEKYSRWESPFERQETEASIRAAVAKTRGGPAEVHQAAEKAANDLYDQRNRRDRVEAAVEKHGKGLHGNARSAVEAAAQRAAAGVTSGSPAEIARAADEAAARKRREYATGYAQAQDRLYERSGTMSKLGLPGVGYQTARVGQVASGLNDAGFTQGAAMLSRAAVPLAVAAVAFEKATHTTQALALAYHDRYSTDAMKARTLFREVVPYGQQIQAFADAISGRAAGMEQAQVTGQIRSHREAVSLEQTSTFAHLMPTVAGRGTLSEAYRLGSPVLPPVLNRGTDQGEQAYRDAMKLLPLKRAVAQADRESKVATAERAQAETATYAAASKIRDLERERERRVRDRDRGGSGVEFEQAGRQIEVIDATLGQARAFQRQTEQRLYDARGREARAKGEAERARVQEEFVGRAEVLQGQAERAKSGAVKLGMMNPLERQMAAHYVAMAKEHGLDALTPEMKAQVLSIAPQFGEMSAAQAGARDPAYQYLQRLGISDFPGKPGESPFAIQRKADEARRTAEEKGYEIDSRVAAEIDKFGERLVQVIAQGFKALSDRIPNVVEDAIRLRRNAR